MSEEVNADYEQAYKDLQAKIDYLKEQIRIDKESRKEDHRTLSDKEIKELNEQIKRLEDFRNAMPKPGQCYGYHGK